MSIRSVALQRNVRCCARTLAAGTIFIWLAGCAADRLSAVPPGGVNLSGEWQLNPNLSDQNPAPDDSSQPANTRHRGGRGRGGRGAGPGGAGGGLSPFGTPEGTADPGAGVTDDFTSRNAGGYGGGVLGTAGEPVATSVRTLWQHAAPTAAALPPSSGTGRLRSNRFGHLLDAPARMTITQVGGKVTVQSRSPGGDLVTTEYTFGVTRNVPMGQSIAERNVGWQGPVFMVTTKVKDGPTKEEDFALDDDGRLIVSTFMSGGHMPKIDMKRVYDRVTNAQTGSK